MPGALMQLVAYGAQDVYLTGNPQMTFFKTVYRRHTNFSMESIQQTFSGSGGSSGSPVCTISRNGDLVHKMYLVQTTAAAAGFPLNPALAALVISTVELEIGGQRIDRQTSQWMDTWNELSTPESKAIGLKSMTGQIGGAGLADQTGVKDIRIPLQFWFCRNPGLALPLIALQYHEVKVKFTLGAFTGDARFDLYCDYIYLDTDERRRFAQVSHEYLIEQVQEQSTSAAANKLNFNHPVKELIWSTAASVGTGTLKLNGHDRFSTREAEYFELQQPYDYHTAVPRQNLPSAAQLTSNYVQEGAATTVSLKDDISLNAGAVLAPTGSDAHIAVFDNFISSTAKTSAIADATPAARIPLTGIVFPDIASVQTAFGPSVQADASGPSDTFRLRFPVGSEAAADVVQEEILVRITRTVTLTASDNNGVAAGEYSGVEAVAVFLDKQVFEKTSHVTGGLSADMDMTITKLSPEFPAFKESRTSQSTKHIGVYSFALKPEEHQPSGTCNFSRIDNAELTFGASTVNGVIYAVNYNVLRIMSGMGGLAYSN